MTTKDDKLVKKAQSMTTGVTASRLELGTTIDLHGHSVRITHTDADQTLVQYANLARRTFDTHALNGYLDLGVFPVGTAFERPTAPSERAIIEAVTGDCCYQVRITAGSDAPRHESFTYADFIGWHMNNSTIQLQALLDEAAADDANPLETELQQRVQQLEATPEALATMQAVINDLRAKLEAANKELQQQSIDRDVEKNTFQREILELKEMIRKQAQMHETVVAGYEQDIERLEAKAAIISPVCKEYCVKSDITESDLNKMAREGWQVQHMQFVIIEELNVVFVRDLPASPAPKVAATDAAIYGTVPPFRPSVQPPPMPAGQVIVNLNQPISRPLTNNVSRIPGETKKIPTLAQLQERRATDAAEIKGIIDQTTDNLETLRRKFANQPNPFRVLGAQ